MKVIFRASFASVLALGVATAVATPAFAQDAAPQTDDAAAAVVEDVAPGEIVVTAQKRAERLQDVPLAVTAVTSDALAKRQINDTNSLVQAIPSLSYQQGANPTNTSFRVRGIGTALFGQGVESSVSVVVDGVVAVRSAQGFSDLADIERVEVLRGPQGTLFGKNASAGVISVTTARPSDDLEFKGDVTVAEHDEYRARATLSAPLTDTVRARVSGFYNDVKGVTYNLGTQDWVNGTQSWGVRGKLEWDAADNLNILLTGEYRKMNSDCCASTLISIVNPLLQQVVGPIEASRENRTVNEDTNTYANSKAQTYSLQADWDLGPATLTSLTAYQKYFLEVNQPIDRINSTSPIYLGTAAFAPYTYWTQNHGIVDIDAISQELRLSSNGKNDLNYVVGVFYMHSDILRPFDRRRARCTAGTVGQPCATANVVWQSSASSIRLKQDSIAAFAQADYLITGGLRAIGGVRVQYEKGTNSGARIAPIVAGDNIFPGNPPVSGTFTASDTAVTGKAGLQYEFNRNAQVYATYTRGYKGLGYEMEISADLANQTAVQPEWVNAYEIGFKGSTADRSLTIAAALFQSDYSNLQVQANRSDPTTGVIQFVTTNAGSSRSRGFEIEATLRPTDGFSINAAVTYAQSRININGLNCPIQQQAAAPVLTGTPVNICYRTAAGATPMQNLRNRALQASPDWRINVSPRYDYEGDSLNAFAQVAVNFTSAQNFTAELDPLTVQPAYTLVDATVGISTPDNRYSLTVFAKNLFDTNYLTSIGHNSLMSTTANPFDLVGTYNKDASRYFGATIGVRF
ncbi:TonB-dependent receptor [Novosphingobium sp. SL115]|uniref:TonB-dependent receptor n=1 Tax=Novosphingobium sp. SL115 TaxID=2995150 RepID=UPI002275AB88|nr:TonB-dependent receptor [Novosphingobium sp. SL115]MCY1672941.1 TonB-dependent receptor [Novosphingobium sp. SL115]